MKTIAIAAACAAAACFALPAGQASAAEHTLKVSSPTNNDSILKWMQGFETALEAATEGAIDVQLFPANQLGQIPATVEGVVWGAIEVTAPASGFFVKLDGRFEALNAPGVFTSFENAQATLASPEVLDRLATWGADQGIETIAAFPHGPLALLTSTPVEKAADLKGLRIRMAGPTALSRGPFDRLGAAAVSMPLGEVLPALQNGVVDGLVAGMPVYTTFRYYDVARDMTVLPESFLVVTAVASRAFLDRIGPEMADKVRAAARAALPETNAWNREAMKGVEASWREHGGRIVSLAGAEAEAWRDAVAATMPEAEAEQPALAGEIAFLRAAAAAAAQ